MNKNQLIEVMIVNTNAKRFFRKPWFLYIIRRERYVYEMAYCMYHNKIWSDYETCDIIL